MGLAKEARIINPGQVKTPGYETLHRYGTAYDFSKYQNSNQGHVTFWMISSNLFEIFEDQLALKNSLIV